MRKAIIIITALFLSIELAVGGEVMGKNIADVEAARDHFARLAARAYHKERWSDCIQHYKEHLKLWPVPSRGLTADVSLRLGVSHLNLDNLREAGKYLELVTTRLDPEYLEAHAFIAVLYAKCGLIPEMRASLLEAASLGFDILEFMEKSNTEALTRLAGDASFIMEVLDREKFVFSEPAFDPFVCPIKPIEPDDEGKGKKTFLPPEVQRRLISEAETILEELEILTREEKRHEDAGTELEKKYARVKEIISMEDKFKELAGELAKIRIRVEKLEIGGKFREIRRRYFVKAGNGMLKRMIFHLNSGEFEKVYLWHGKLERHILRKKTEFREEARWLAEEAVKILATAEKREEFHKLNLEISGTVLMDPERQVFYRKRFQELEKKLAQMKGPLWPNSSQTEIENLEKEIEYYREKVRPKFVIINGYPYEIGHPIHGLTDVRLVELDKDFAYFDYMGERLRLGLPRVLSATSN